MVFGADPGPSFGAFAPTHRPDQVEAALRGYFAPDDLERLTKQVRKAACLRERKGKDAGPLKTLAGRLQAAAGPPAVPVAMRWHPSEEGGEPLACVLLDGERAGQTVTTVPPGVRFQFAGARDAVPHTVFCQPVDDRGDELGDRAWGLGGGDVRLWGGTFMVPFDAIRTGDARDAH